MSDHLPEEILEEIFLRLPRKSLLRFRCVNKSYRALFNSRRFQGMYHDLYNIKNKASYMLFEDKHNKRYEIDYKSVSSLLPLSTSSTATMCDCREIIKPEMDYPSIFQDFDKVECLSSIDSFYWIRTVKNSREEFYIWNSKTKVCQKIPMAPQVNDYAKINGYGFGCDYKTDDCKLIRIAGILYLRFSEADVYTLKSNSWKRIQIPYYVFYRRPYNYGVLYEGALHWLAITSGPGKYSIHLACFNIANERFQEVALPEELITYSEPPLERTMFKVEVKILGGCLCLVYHVFDVRVDIWLMQEYGVRESWEKSFSTTLESITSSSFTWLIWNFKNNETLWKVDGGFVLYDPNNKIYRKLMWDSGFTECITVAEN